MSQLVRLPNIATIVDAPRPCRPAFNDNVLSPRVTAEIAMRKDFPKG